MENQSQIHRGFVSARHYEARYRSQAGEQTLLCEVRATADEQRVFHTVLDGREVRASSVYEFILIQPDCISVSIQHSVWVMWNGEPKRAVLLEELIKAADDSFAPIHTQVRLMIDGETFASEECDTLTDAIMELSDTIGPSVPWRLKTCHHCIYAWPAFLYPVSDREELRCYRDAPPEAFDEVVQKLKFASRDALYSGHYFVTAFHTCAAWRARERPSG